MTTYRKQQKTMITILLASAAVVTLNIIAVTTGVAESHYAELHSWISANLN
ncbi:hypothetical protein ACFL3P_00050 [Pseudomonadota bacterium]